MARKLNPQGLIDQKNYLFQNHAQYQDKVFSTFQSVAQRNKLPVSCTEDKYKSGGMFGSKDILLTVDGDFKPFAVLGCVTYGNFLSVNLYFLVEDNFMNKLAGKAMGTGLDNLAYISEDMISVRNVNAFWNTVVACLEEAFAEMKFQEFKGGFLGVKYNSA